MDTKQIVRHLLLLNVNGKIGVVEMVDRQLEIISFKGENIINFDKGFWTKMINYTSFEEGQAADLCIISHDDMKDLPKALTAVPCEAASVWNARTVEDAVKLIAPPCSMEIYSLGGGRLTSYSAMFSKDEPLSLTAKYRGSEKYKAADETAAADKQSTVSIKQPQIRHEKLNEDHSDSLTDEEYEQSTPLTRMFIDLDREYKSRRK